MDDNSQLENFLITLKIAHINSQLTTDDLKTHCDVCSAFFQLEIKLGLSIIFKVTSSVMSGNHK